MNRVRRNERTSNSGRKNPVRVRRASIFLGMGLILGLGLVACTSLPTTDALGSLGPGGSAPTGEAPTGTTPTGTAPAPTSPAQRQAIPVPNGGFENDLESWSSWQSEKNDTPQATGTQGAHGGGKYAVLSSKAAQKQNILQDITGLSSGTYTLEMWIRTSGGQAGLILFALDYGGKELNASVPVAENATWTKYILPDIKVTTGQVKIGLFSSAPAGTIWAHLDDVALYREADSP